MSDKPWKRIKLTKEDLEEVDKTAKGYRTTGLILTIIGVLTLIVFIGVPLVPLLIFGICLLAFSADRDYLANNIKKRKWEEMGKPSRIK